MNKTPESTGPVGRRSIIKGAASAGLISATSVPTILQASESRSAQPELVRNENSKPGTRDWMLTKTRTVPGKINKILYNGRCQQIEGYCNANSVRAGESWHGGPIVLSWSDVMRGSLDGEDGHNVVLHEFAHKLDEENLTTNGMPILRNREQYASWVEVLNKEYDYTGYSKEAR